MTTANCAVPTTKGDGVNPVDSWTGAVAGLRLTPQFKPGIVPTTFGDGIHAETAWAFPTITELAFTRAQHVAIPPFGSLDPVRGYVFVIDPNTLQPQLPRNTQFPAAQ